MVEEEKDTIAEITSTKTYNGGLSKPPVLVDKLLSELVFEARVLPTVHFL